MPGMDQWRSLLPGLAPFTVDPAAGDPCDFAPDDPEGHRLELMQWHTEAVSGWHRDTGANPRIYQPGGEPLPWQRGDLVWALSRHGPGSGAGPLVVPSMIVQGIPAAWLAECAPALTALVARLRDDDGMPAHVRQTLADRFGQALARSGDTTPAFDDRFSTAIYPILAGVRDDPATMAALDLAGSLTRPVPSKAWLRRAETVSAQVPAAIRDVLQAFCGTAGPVHADHDSLLRGVCWLAAAHSPAPATEPPTVSVTAPPAVSVTAPPAPVSGEPTALPAAEVTELLARVAVLAGEPSAWTVHPRAARTAAAAVEILAGRPGPATSRALERMARTARSRPLLARVHTALERSGGLLAQGER